MESSKLGLVNSCLSQLEGATTKREFCVGLAKGLGANMEPAVRGELLLFLTRCTSEGDLLAPNPGATIYSIMRGEDDGAANDAHPGNLVVTRDSLVNASIFAKWLQRGEPLLVVGPQASVKLKQINVLLALLAVAGQFVALIQMAVD